MPNYLRGTMQRMIVMTFVSYEKIPFRVKFPVRVEFRSKTQRVPWFTSVTGRQYETKRGGGEEYIQLGVGMWQQLPSGFRWPPP
jgi:hypothetical protein